MNQLQPTTRWLDLGSLDEPLAYHDPDRGGFTSILVPALPKRQRSFWLSELPQRLEWARGLGVDAYIAQNEFWRPNRRLLNCWRLTSCYVDLDTYTVEELRGREPEALLDALLASCVDSHIPEPSLVVYSGRGLQAKWSLSAPVPASALPRWKAVQQWLCETLRPLGADPRSLDASRVLRLVGTVNSRSGDVVRVIHRAAVPTLGASRADDGLIVHDFETLAETVLPIARIELERERSERRQRDSRKELDPRQSAASMPPTTRSSRDTWVENRGARRLDPRTLAWDRLCDLKKLVRLRGWTDGVPVGQRNNMVFLGACFLAKSAVAPAFGLEVRELASQFAPDWSHAEITRCVSSVRSRMEMARSGVLVEYKGEKVDPRYRFTNARLIEWLEMTSAEMASMKTIIDADESRRRDRGRKERERREAGATPQAEIHARHMDRVAEARRLRNEGLSYTSIAQRLGLARGTVFGYCKES